MVLRHQTSRHRGVLASWYEQFREIALPRPLPNPPEYVPPPRSESFPKVSVMSYVQRIRQGLVMYADTWRTPKDEQEGTPPLVLPGSDEHGVGGSLDDEDTAPGGGKKEAASSVIRKEYGMRVRAFQVAVKEFVKGFHEGVGSKV